MVRWLPVLLLALCGCASRELAKYNPKIDLTPLGCGYKWFQTGYSPTREYDCDMNRDAIRETELKLANENAWEVAHQRCPAECKPVELKDSVQWQNPHLDGVCRSGVVYFNMRIFLSCAR